MKGFGLVSIAGLVGIGKTTLAGGLSRALSAGLILEEYDQNPFLADHLQGKGEAKLACELFFLLSRARQLQKRALRADGTVICDYVFQKNRIFAGMNLNEQQFAIYDQLEKTVQSHITTPRIVLYLRDTAANCHERISRRGRDYEKDITLDWLDRLDAAYEKLFDKWNICPVLRIDCAQYDFRQESVIDNIAQQLIHDGLVSCNR